jgi:alginate O-acetyltransferase complex protein AlgI
MLFHTHEFLIFLIVVLVLFYSVPPRIGRLVLLAASYFFYAWWNARFLVFLATLTLIDYWAGNALVRVRADRRKLVLVLSLSANLAFLGFFKYYNFLAASLAQLLGLPENSFFIAVVLPLGISFHTFQSISYVVDVYRGEQEPIRSLPDYALFISFFPQLVAGPIVRAREFFRDLYDWQRPSYLGVQDGVLLFVTGLAKKIVFADQFGQAADAYFNNLRSQPGMLTAWTGALAFGMQIFLDFSGYTDMAIGCAKFFGFEFPQNFRRPYLASSITEFWRRWHMSLSRWLRDYLYIPLGGSRYGAAATYRNLMITMLLGGLWHGASWRFILWGGWHGCLLCCERMAGRRPAAAGLLYPFRVLVTFIAVLLGWVLFRASSVADSWFVYRQMITGGGGPSMLGARHWFLIVFSAVVAVAEERRGLWAGYALAPRWAQIAILTGVLLSLEFFAVTGDRIPFVYFQF